MYFYMYTDFFICIIPPQQHGPGRAGSVSILVSATCLLSIMLVPE